MRDVHKGLAHSLAHSQRCWTDDSLTIARELRSLSKLPPIVHCVLESFDILHESSRFMKEGEEGMERRVTRALNSHLIPRVLPASPSVLGLSCDNNFTILTGVNGVFVDAFIR